MKRRLTCSLLLLAFIAGGCPSTQPPGTSSSTATSTSGNDNSGGAGPTDGTTSDGVTSDGDGATDNPGSAGSSDNDAGRGSSLTATCGFDFPQGVTKPPTSFFVNSQTLGFDEIGDELPIDTHYLSRYGVRFSTLAGGKAVAQARGDATWGSDAISLPNTLAISGSDTLIVSFTYANKRPTKVGLVVADAAPSNSVTLTAFDSRGQTLVSKSFSVASDASARSTTTDEDRFVAICTDAEIAKLEIRIASLSLAGVSGWEIDDFVYGD